MTGRMVAEAQQTEEQDDLRIGLMQNRTDAGQQVWRIGKMQDRKHGGQVGFSAGDGRTGRMQADGHWTGYMLESGH